LRLAAAVVTGGLLFSGSATFGANLIEDPSFTTPQGGGHGVVTDAWGTYTAYAQSYGGIFGPDLNATDDNGLQYGYYDDITLAAGETFHGLSFPGENSQTISLTELTPPLSSCVTHVFEFSAWLAGCCNDTPALTATFDTGEVFKLDRGVLTNQVTTADQLENPGGPNNFISQTDRSYWALYETRGIVPAAASEVTISIDEGTNSVGNGDDLYADVVVFDVTTSPVLPIPELLTMELDLSTGEISIHNRDSCEPLEIQGYTIQSEAGALLPDEATFLSESDPAWTRNTQSGATDNLSETRDVPLALEGNESLNLGTGWLQYFRVADDITFFYLDGDGNSVPGYFDIVGTPFDQGDLDFDHDIDGDDWLTFAGGMGTDQAEGTVAQTYRSGDLNSDLTTNHSDFLEFKKLFEAANLNQPLGQVAPHTVPEPAAFVLVLIAAASVPLIR